MSLSMLFSEVDEKETVKKARNFFNYDLDKYLLLSDDNRASLKSPIIDGQPKGSNFDSNDYKVLKVIDAQKIIQSVSKAISNLQDNRKHPYKTIIINRYINSLSIEQLGYKIGCSNSHTALLVNKALIEFATRFLVEQLNSQVSKPIDLTVYKS